MIASFATKTSTANTTIAHAVSTFSYIVTFRNRVTGDEQTTEITTLSDSFLPVLREVQGVRAELGLLGYEIFEVLDLNNPF